jgi:BirA family biotin operon repressor/biotin-[acetyl-CoA-carboxylase] ligase
LVVGVAGVKTLAEAGIDARLKWPNDVVAVGADDVAEQVPGWGTLKKLAGILCEAHGDAVVAGIGINVSQTAGELPVPHAASLASLGATHLDRVALLESLARHVAAEIDAAERDATMLRTAFTPASGISR